MQGDRASWGNTPTLIFDLDPWGRAFARKRGSARPVGARDRPSWLLRSAAERGMVRSGRASGRHYGAPLGSISSRAMSGMSFGDPAFWGGTHSVRLLGSPNAELGWTYAVGDGRRATCAAAVRPFSRGQENPDFIASGPQRGFRVWIPLRRGNSVPCSVSLLSPVPAAVRRISASWTPSNPQNRPSPRGFQLRKTLPQADSVSCSSYSLFLAAQEGPGDFRPPEGLPVRGASKSTNPPGFQSLRILCSISFTFSRGLQIHQPPGIVFL